MSTCTFSRGGGSRRKEEGERSEEEREEREGKEREREGRKGKREEVLPSPILRTHSADSFLNLSYFYHL